VSVVLPAFALARPETLDEALVLLSEDRVPFCGGTELLLAMKMGLHRPDALVDVKRLAELRGVTRDDGHLVIGAATTHAELTRNPLVGELLPLLRDVERRVGNARVRAQGSIGGNLCFAEPKSDVATLLIALRGLVTLRSASAERVVSVQELIEGAYFAAREPDELMVDVRVPVVAGLRGAYQKFQVTERPTIGVAVVEDPDSLACRVVVGAVGEVPAVREFPSVAQVDVDAVIDSVDPVADLTGSVEYKRHVTGVFVRRAIAALEGGSDSD
jgi:aerobic carbon-monoxide dehydrogenase medium subunit